jgi:hypothetical protein
MVERTKNACIVLNTTKPEKIVQHSFKVQGMLDNALKLVEDRFTHDMVEREKPMVA